MTKKEQKARVATIAFVIWSNILRKQYLQGWSNEKLCSVLGITPRTMYNYRQDPSDLTMKQVQSFLDEVGIPMTDLLMT